MASPTPSRIGFFDLPPEVRNEIYAYAVAEDEPIETGTRRCQIPEVLYTCRQFYSEGLPMFYSSNIFQACSPASANRFLNGLSDKLLPAIRCLRMASEIEARDDQLRYAGAGAEWWLKYVKTVLQIVHIYDKVKRSAIVMPLIVDGEIHTVWVSLDEVDNFTFRPKEGMKEYGRMSRKQQAADSFADVSGGTR